MSYREWQNDQLHVLIPPKEAHEAFAQLRLPDDPVLATLWSQATGVKFKISGFLAFDTAGNGAHFETLAVSLPVEEARDLARWILENAE